MPAKTDRRHRQGNESRQRILEAALSIAAERGYDGTTVALITERAEVPASSVYWQFTNKDELLAEALDYSYRQWRRDGPTWQPASYTGTPRERIRTRVRLSMQSVERQPEYWRLGLMVAMLRPSSPLAARERFLAVRDETHTVIDDWWRTVLPPEAAANDDFTRLMSRTYLAFVDGMFLAHRANPRIDLVALTDLVGDALADAAKVWADDPEGLLALTAAPVAPVPAEPPAEDSRTRLLAAAEEICAERGYRGTTISRVCARAGLPASSLYWFFTDKDDLMAEVVQHSWDDWLAHQPSWLPPAAGQSWGDALRGILRQSVASLTRAPSFMRIGHMLTLEQQETEVAARTRFLAIREQSLQMVAGWFESAVPAADLARDRHLPVLCALAVLAFTDGFFLGAQIDGAEVPVAPFVELIVTILEHAAAGSA